MNEPEPSADGSSAAHTPRPGTVSGTPAGPGPAAGSPAGPAAGSPAGPAPGPAADQAPARTPGPAGEPDLDAPGETEPDVAAAPETAEVPGLPDEGPQPLGVALLPTGHGEVDARLSRLTEADHLAVPAHLEVYEDVHSGLRETLAALDQRPGPPPAAPPEPRS